jgi:hypothetical protein
MDDETTLNESTSSEVNSGGDFTVPIERRASESSKIMLERVPKCALSASAHLKTQLAGLVRVDITNLQESYLFDWRGEKLIATRLPEAQKEPKSEYDCVLSMTKEVLLRIARGTLNPQVAMLSRKVVPEGKPSFAVYFFNLLRG